MADAMPLGTEVGVPLSICPTPHIYIELPLKGSQQPPLFGPCLLWPDGRPSQELLSSCSNTIIDKWNQLPEDVVN